MSKNHIGRATRFVDSGFPTLLILGPTLLILGPPLSILGPFLLILEPILLILVVKMGVAILKKKQIPSRLLILGLSRINNSGPRNVKSGQKDTIQFLAWSEGTMTTWLGKALLILLPRISSTYSPKRGLALVTCSYHFISYSYGTEN